MDEPVWEHAFTPWPAPRAFRQAPDFGGSADAYLEWIAIDVLPAIEKQFGLNPLWRGVLGYSLAGLFAAYCSYRRFLFNRMAAVSASLWFDGWQQFAAANTPLFLPEYAYFSVGSKEKNAKNPRLAQIETAILATRQNWQAAGAVTFFERNSGGHFENITQHLVKAAQWLPGR
ncbi:alpha/beta hydrolase-fold protein [Neisseria musculi]|uniref:alpha/beta hydrolase-fold protein n=1 Tax=Neisseria musculi TaxID=1815583 RepID=UPI001FE6F6B9|nr:alpha/beta hydrolase-fold protein [Neisseria musculi]